LGSSEEIDPGQQGKMLFPAATLLVKMCLERSAERDKHENKNKISAEYGQNVSGGHLKG
jgi:hypothetical protein